MTVFTGSGVALVTPFDDSGEVDYEALAILLDFHLEQGTDAIIICGTTGEASTLTDPEQIAVVQFSVDYVNHRVPVIAGAGSNDTRHGIALSRDLAATGADALLQVTPYYNKTSQAGLYEHFRLIAEAVDIPIILYNVPSRTGLNLAPATVARLAEIDNIVGIKDATGNLSTTIDIRNLCGPDFAIWSGNDDVIVPVLACGGAGVISVLANVVPAAVHELTSACLAGDFARGLELQTRYQKLVHALFAEPNPIPVKDAMKQLGLPAGGYRAPLVPPGQDVHELLQRELAALNLVEETR